MLKFKIMENGSEMSPMLLLLLCCRAMKIENISQKQAKAKASEYWDRTNE